MKKIGFATLKNKTLQTFDLQCLDWSQYKSFHEIEK